MQIKLVLVSVMMPRQRLDLETPREYQNFTETCKVKSKIRKEILI